jgi:hypothetical protein
MTDVLNTDGLGSGAELNIDSQSDSELSRALICSPQGWRNGGRSQF